MNNQMKNELKKLPKYFLVLSVVLVVSILLGTVSMIAVFSLPIDRMIVNAKTSSELLYKEGEEYSLTTLCKSELDNFTDAIMLANAVYDGDESTVDKAMNVYMNNMDDQGRVLPLYNYLHDIDMGSFHREAYSRYWHGYLVFLKPLLMVTDYQSIRIINLVLQTLINVAIVFLLYKKKLGAYIIPYLISVCFVMPLTTAFSMQYATVFYIFSIASVILLVFENVFENKLKLLLLFLMIGTATSFFDFLTYPIATFGMVAVLYCCINASDSILSKLYNGVLAFFSWGFGYAGMWVGKWLVGTVLTGKNILSSALGSVQHRTSNVSGRGEFSLISVWGKNILAFVKTPVTIVAVIFIVVILIMICSKYKKEKPDLLLAVPYLIVALMPILWYAFAANHSFLHYMFTYKALMVSAFAGLCMFANIYLSKKMKNNNLANINC